MEVIVTVGVACLFYYGARFYLNKYKGYEIPLVPERYYDNPSLNFAQGVIAVIGVIIGFAVAMLLS